MADCPPHSLHGRLSPSFPHSLDLLMPNRFHCAGRRDRRPPAPHQDEFPAEYSLAGCSPAEPASASSAALIFNQQLPFVQSLPANGNCPQTSLSHLVAHPSRLSPSFVPLIFPNNKHGHTERHARHPRYFSNSRPKRVSTSSASRGCGESGANRIRRAASRHKPSN